MPQVFNVLKCYKCNIFQVQQEKKSNKWICKVCNEKQSLKHVFGSGTGYECRQHVQKLNMLKGEEKHLKTNMDTSSNQDFDDEDEDCLDYGDEPEDESTFKTITSEKPQPSRWNKYVEANDCPDVEQSKMVGHLPEKKFSSFKNVSLYSTVPEKSVVVDSCDKWKISIDDPFKITTDIDFDL